VKYEPMEEVEYFLLNLTTNPAEFDIVVPLLIDVISPYVNDSSFLSEVVDKLFNQVDGFKHLTLGYSKLYDLI